MFAFTFSYYIPYIVTLSISTSVSSTTSEYLYKVHLMATADWAQDRWSVITHSMIIRKLNISYSWTFSYTDWCLTHTENRKSRWSPKIIANMTAQEHTQFCSRCKPYISTCFSFKDIAACGSGLGVDVDAGSTVLVLALVKCCVLLGPIIDLWW